MVSYRDDTDQKIAAAIKVEDQRLTAQLQQQFAEQEKSPYKTYSGPNTYGTIRVVYPKSWSGYVSVDGTSDTPVDGYFYPDIVPNSSDTSINFAMRVQVVQEAYTDALANYETMVQEGSVTARPFHLAKVPSVVGIELSGQIDSQKTGMLVVLPVRDQTILIWTEGQQFQNDFNNIILSNLSFSP